MTTDVMRDSATFSDLAPGATPHGRSISGADDSVLCNLGLKDGTIWEPGGWHCYITNVIKQAAAVGEWE